MRTDTNIRRPRQTDLLHLVDIDIKCFEDTLTQDDWKNYIENINGEMLVCVLDSEPVGYIIWDKFFILRIAVKPAYSYLGLGTRLLHAVETIILKRGMKLAFLYCPESLCNPNQPQEDISGWLTRAGYKASGVCHNGATYCGNTEDAYVFRKQLEEVRFIYG